MKKLLTLSSLILSFIFTIQISWSQIVGTDAFIKAVYLEMGISGDGAYVASTNPPAGYHDGAAFPYFGMIIDDAKDGWDVGTPLFCGDYFAPGSPVEGFAVQVGENVYSNGPFATPEIPGSIVSYSATPASRTVIWNGNIAAAGLQVKQITVVKNSKRFVTTQISITNTGATAVNGVYYSRNADPDNDEEFSFDFVTENLVLYNHPTDEWAMVTATGLEYGCLLALGSAMTNARVSYGGFSMESLIPKNAYNGASPHFISGSTTSDEAITLTFKIGTINAGQTKIINFVYGSDLDEVAAAIVGFTNDGIANRQELEANGYSNYNPVISLSPVPTNGPLNIIASGVDPDADVQIQILNLLGQIVFSKNDVNQNGTVMETVSLSNDLPNGTYLVNVIVDGKSNTETFVLSK